jgi:hypothetical protein
MNPAVSPAAMPRSGGFNLNSFLNSPGLAMANQAVNNISALRRNQVPQMTPTQAYQRSLMANEELLLRKDQERRAKEQQAQMARYRDLQMQGMQRKLDPMADFDSVVERLGLSGKPIEEQVAAYKDFMKSTAAASNRISKTFIGDNGNMWTIDATGNPTDTGVAVAEGKMFDLPGGGKAWRGPDGNVTTIVTPQEAITGSAQLAAATTSAEEGEKTKADQVRTGLTGAQDARLAYQSAQAMLDITNEYLDRFAPGVESVDTGFVPAMMLRMFGIGDEALGQMNADTISAALQNLGITNLAPVTEQEFASVMQMWGDIAKDESVNRGALESARQRTERLMERLKADAIYNAGLVEEYGSEAQYGSFLRANPFVGQMMNANDDDPEVGF